MSTTSPTPIGTFAERQAAFEASPEGIAKRAAKEARKNKYKSQGQKAAVAEFADFMPVLFASQAIRDAKVKLLAGNSVTLSGDAMAENVDSEWAQHMAGLMDGAVISCLTDVEVELEFAARKLNDARMAGVIGAGDAMIKVMDFAASLKAEGGGDE